MASSPVDDRAAALAVLGHEPARTAVLLDFDGTLAPIVLDPAAAVPLPGVPEALAALAGPFGRVAVVSGRPVAYLLAHLPPAVTVVGLYGLERAVGGVVELHPDAERWQPVIAGVVAAARAELPAGVLVEDKGLSCTLHVRAEPDLEPVVQAWATGTGERTGLEVRRARRSAELHPPVAADKGTVATELLEGMAAACFIGDDVGDLPAFAALEAFAAQDGAAVRVAVTSSEAAPELLAAADLTLDGPPAVLAFLQDLADPQ